ncbi:hypothetical protein ES707_03632 [subsurface metagenome]
MIPVDYEWGQKIVETCTCECGAAFTMPWGGSWGIDSYVLKCTRDINHNRIARPARLGPYDIPGFNLFNLKGRKREMEQELGKERAGRLVKYEGVVSLTKSQATEIIKTCWPKAPELEVYKAALICRDYGLNPLMKHVFLVPFKNKAGGEDWAMMLGIKATRLIASRLGDYSYMDNTPRVMTTEEEERTFGELDPGRIWAVTTVRKKGGFEAHGYGNWPRDQVPHGAEKGNTKANMAFIRSERNALDRLFPGAMPQGVQVVDEEYAESLGESPLDKEEGGKPPAKKKAPPAGKKESESGEKSAAPGAARETEAVGEGSAGDFSEQEQGREKKSEGPAAEGAWQTPDDVTEDDIPDYNAAFRACAHFYRTPNGNPLQPDHVAKQMGFRVSKDLFSSRIPPWDVWLNIKKLNEET